MTITFILLTSWQCIPTKAGFWVRICWHICSIHCEKRFCGSSNIEPTFAVMSRIGTELPGSTVCSEEHSSKFFGVGFFRSWIV